MSKTLVHITTQYSENYGTFENPHWKFKIFKTNNNGLTVLERYK
jgi:hypothetical protein